MIAVSASQVGGAETIQRVHRFMPAAQSELREKHVSELLLQDLLINML